MKKNSLFLLIACFLIQCADAQPLVKRSARRSPPHAIAPTQLLVKWKEVPTIHQTKRALRLNTEGLYHLQTIDRPQIDVLKIPPGKTAEEALADLQKNHPDEIEHAEIDHIYYLALTPNDPDFPSQYHLNTIGAPTAWDTTTGSGITIAIADTGVNSSHPDLAAHMTTGTNLGDGNSDTSDQEDHGTWVAGTAAAVGNNGIGVAGGAFNATIMPIKVTTGAGGSTSSSILIQAIYYAADHGAKVINISFASSSSCDGSFINDAGTYMKSKGGLVVKAAGNDGIDKGCSNDPDIIDVSATDSSDALASFSNTGNEIDVAAPGVNIVTTDRSGGYASVDGTSFSTPLTASVIALIWAVDPTFTPAQVQQILFDSAVDLGTGGYDTSFGWGRISAANAVRLSTQRSLTFQTNTLQNVYAYPNPWDIRRTSNRQVTIANVPDTATIKLFTISGAWIRNLTASNSRALWDLKNDSGEMVASGLYFYIVQNGDSTARGTIAVIK